MFNDKFDSYVVDGDSIACEVDGFLCVATLYFDEDTQPEPDNPALAEWRDDKWHYFGVEVVIYRDSMRVASAARWGIEGNYPAADPRGNTNGYFSEVANDLLPEAVANAKAMINKWAKELTP